MGTKALLAIGVPIDCVAAARQDDALFGTELSPAALRAAGLLSAIDAADGGDLDVRLVGRDRDSDTGVLAWPSVRAVTSAVRMRVGEVVRRGQRPFVVGGCCTPLPGAVAGARDAIGDIGLAYLDGHLDLYDGQTSPTGEPADMPIAVVVGHGPSAWVHDVAGPVVAPDRLALLGPRDRDEAITYGSILPEQLGMRREWTPDALRTAGVCNTAEMVVAQLGRYWVHLDVDVLDEAVFPATDYLMPGGLDWDELRSLLRPLAQSDACVGLSLGCYNPDKDPSGNAARGLVGLLSDVLSP